MLKPRKRIRKKEIKQDKLVTIYFKVNDWLTENSKYVIGGLIAVIVIVAATFIYSTNQQKNEEKASVELAAAQRLVDANQYRDAVDKLTSLVNEFGGTNSGRVARFYLATAQYNLGEYPKAKENFEQYLAKKVDDDLLNNSALTGQAASLEQMGNYVEAAKLYVKAAEKYSKDVLAGSALYRAARCYLQADDRSDALRILEKIISDYSESDVVDKAKVQLASLMQKESTTEVVAVEP